MTDRNVAHCFPPPNQKAQKSAGTQKEAEREKEKMEVPSLPEAESQTPNHPYYYLNNYYYDPSQQQGGVYYDQSYYSYYHYSQQHQQHDQQEQHYGYHHHQQSLGPPTYHQPPHPRSYYDYHNQQQQQQQQQLLQLTHFTGTVAAGSHHEVPPHIGQPPYWQSGKLHGRQPPHWHGGKWHSGEGNSSFPRRGIVKDKGKAKAKAKKRTKNSKLQDGTSMSSNPVPSTAQRAEPIDVMAVQTASENTGPSSAAPERMMQFAQAPDIVGPNSRPQRIAWCELCRVDCTSLEILEQHKNGKQHKKNLMRTGTSENVSKPGTETQIDEVARNSSKSEESQKPEEIPLGAPSTVNGAIAIIQANKEEEPKVLAGELSNLQERNSGTNVSNKKRRGIKRKTSDDQGSKRVKAFKTPKKPPEPRKPKVVIPLICDLCNVKCDTQEVLSRHLSGKKHIAKLKRFESHQALYGTAGIQALYPPNPISKTLVIPQAQGNQAFHGPHLSIPPPSQVYQAADAAHLSIPPPSQVYQAADAATGLGAQHMQTTVQSGSPNTSMLASRVP